VAVDSPIILDEPVQMDAAVSTVEEKLPVITYTGRVLTEEGARATIADMKRTLAAIGSVTGFEMSMKFGKNPAPIMTRREWEDA
jgi:hypothetical protein